jgi:cleavage and polyadenylation specificity factor subunit 1
MQVFQRSGQLTVYQGLPLGQQTEAITEVRASHLDIKFVKVSSLAFEIQRPEESAPGEKAAVGVLAEQKKIPRVFVPFSTTTPTGTTYSGVFFTGDRPNWIFSTDHGGLQVYPSGHAVVNAFTACSLWEGRSDFLMYTEDVRLFLSLVCGLPRHFNPPFTPPFSLLRSSCN